jgi:hypothetical protein
LRGHAAPFTEPSRLCRAALNEDQPFLEVKSHKTDTVLHGALGRAIAVLLASEVLPKGVLIHPVLKELADGVTVSLQYRHVIIAPDS